MTRTPAQTGFEPRTRDPERRDFFDLQRRIARLEAGGGSGGGGGGEEVFIGPTDPGTPFELWYDTDAVSGAWTSLTLLTGWTGSAAYRMLGDVVQVRGRVTNSSGGALTNTSPVCTLPAGARPPANQSIALPRTSPVSVVVFDIWVVEASTGNLRLATGGSYANGTVLMLDTGLWFAVS